VVVGDAASPRSGDIPSVALFLASDDSSYVNDMELVVAGQLLQAIPNL
jgi:hypothetical protein